MGSTNNDTHTIRVASGQENNEIKICTNYHVDDTQQFWNDVNQEKKNAFWIDDDNGEKFFKLINTADILPQYKIIINKFVTTFSPTKDSLCIVDLACGVGWTSALLSKEFFTKEIHSVDFSMHRLHMFDKYFSILKGDMSKCTRYFASFYELPFEDNTIDIIFVSQGLHHADDISRLLQECYRILSKNGKIIFIGEQFIPLREWSWEFFKNIIKHLIHYKTRKPIAFAAANLFPYDKVLGDHYYTKFEYRMLLQKNKFEKKFLLPRGNTLCGIYEKMPS